MDRFLSLEAFITVAKTRSFADAARYIGVSKSVITTRVRQLEDYIGVPLFHRNTRNVRLSEVGQSFLGECTELINRTEELVQQMRDVKGTPSGLLRVHALPGFVLRHLSAHLRDFQEQHPEILLDFVVSDEVVDPLRSGADCTLQILSPVSEDLIGRKLFPVRRAFCASPAYLERHGRPECPGDLNEHRLGLYSGYPSGNRWVFHGSGKEVALDLQPALRSNSLYLLEEYATEGAGIVCIPTLAASSFILSGELELVLPDWQLSSFWLSAVYPRTHRGEIKLKLFVESLLAKFAPEPPWDIALFRERLIPPLLVE